MVDDNQSKRIQYDPVIVLVVGVLESLSPNKD